MIPFVFPWHHYQHSAEPDVIVERKRCAREADGEGKGTDGYVCEC
jgi:hypothetical protein